MTQDNEERLRQQTLEIEALVQRCFDLEVQLKISNIRNNVYREVIELNTNIKLKPTVVMDETKMKTIESIAVEIENLASEFNLITSVYEMEVYPSDKKPTKENKTKKLLIDDIPTTKIISSKEEDENETKSKRLSSYKNLKSHLLPCDLEWEINRKQNIDNQVSYRTNIQTQQINLPNAETLFNEHYENLTNTKRAYSSILTNICSIRSQLVRIMTFPEYELLIKNQVEVLEKILKAKNINDNKRIVSTITKCLTPLDMRLLRYPSYTNYQISIDQVQDLAISLDLSFEKKNEYEVFCFEIISQHLFNYGSVVCTLKQIVLRLLNNHHGYHNLVYVPIKQSSLKDPFSFYKLEKIYKDKRYWLMDCRLDDFTTNLIHTLLPFLIETFRRIYMDVFHDNDFRKDYKTKCHITAIDCEQLLQNIILLSNKLSLCSMLRELVIENFTFYPTESDRFNIYGDDSLQRKHFAETIRDDQETVDIIKQLFDKITLQEAIDFLQERR